MAEALTIIGNDDLLMAANPLTVQLFSTMIVWTYRDIWQNYLWDAEDLIYQKEHGYRCLLYTSPSPRDLSTSRMPSSA